MFALQNAQSQRAINAFISVEARWNFVQPLQT